MAVVSFGLGAGFWSSRLQWDPEMRLWKSAADAALVLLVFAVGVGPVSRLWPRARSLLRWRREAGVWFTVMASLHVVLILNGWVRWSVMRFLGYEFVPQLGREVRLESGLGLANIIGAQALVWALVLAATSSDRAVRALGPPAWKWLHHGAYVVLYLSAVHAGYYLFQHYTFSFHRPVPPPDWFRFPFLALTAGVVGLQFAACARTARRRS